MANLLREPWQLCDIQRLYWHAFPSISPTREALLLVHWKWGGGGRRGVSNTHTDGGEETMKLPIEISTAQFSNEFFPCIYVEWLDWRQLFIVLFFFVWYFHSRHSMRSLFMLYIPHNKYNRILRFVVHSWFRFKVDYVDCGRVFNFSLSHFLAYARRIWIERWISRNIEIK